MADDIEQWLQGLGLGQYARVFAENDIDFRAVGELSDNDLKDLGLSLGHRRILQGAIRKQTEEPQPSRLTTPAADGHESQLPAEAERRQLTVLFCDLVGSTALSSRLDPEDMRDVLRGYQDACAGVVARYDGYVAKFMGDGVFAYFGYPTAHEDDAERAINAGIGVVEAVSRLPNDLRVRIGVATGTVAVGDIVGTGASEEAAIVGDAPNLAARLQGIADPNGVVIGPSTYSLAGRLFECRSLGDHVFKGLDQPTSAWAVVRPRLIASRFSARSGDRLTRLVGREEEREILRRRWQRTKDGNGQAVLISGEPGIGKSRLLHSLAEDLADDQHYLALLQCSPYHTNSALYPFIEQMGRAIGFEPGDDEGSRREKLASWVEFAGQDVQEAGPLFGSLFDIDRGDRWPELAMSAQRQKALTLQKLADRPAYLADDRPFVFLVEDAHWIDPTSLELLDILVERALSYPIFIVITCRLEFSSPWTGRPHVTLLPLNRLDRHACATMTDSLTGGKLLPEAVRDQIIEKTDGVPLFVEELTKSVLESGLVEELADQFQLTGEVGDLAVPATLQDSLEARLDRLAAVKEIAQIGSVIGREFPYFLLLRVSGLEEADLQDALDRLIGSELVFARGQVPDATYTFKHALVQDTAYGSLLRGRRKELHTRVARALEEHFPEIVEAQPDLLAHHFEQAGLAADAAQYALKASGVAMEGANYAEADGQLRKGLEIIRALPEGSDRASLELEIQIGLSWVVRLMRGPAHDGNQAVLERAYQLCSKVGTDDQLFQILFGLCLMHTWRANVSQAVEDARRLLEIAESGGSQSQIVPANAVLAQALWHHGENSKAQECFDRLNASYDQNTDLFAAYGFGVFHCRSHGAENLFSLGYPDRALRLGESSLALAESTGDPVLEAMAVFHLSVVHAWRTEPERLLPLIEARWNQWEEIGIEVFLAACQVVKSWAATKIGCIDDGPEQVRDGIDRWNALRLGAWTPAFCALLADAQLSGGNAVEAVETADETLAQTSDSREIQFDSQLLGIKGDAHYSLGQLEDAESCYRKAIETATAQSAKSWEIRAATHLARLWQSQGMVTEARELIAPIHGWFSEGFDTANLKDAKALLDELNRP